MSTTVAHRRTTRFPGKGIGLAVIGLALAAAIGYGISAVGDEPVEETVSGGSTAQPADEAMLNSARAGAAAGAVGSQVSVATSPSIEELAKTLAQSATGSLSVDAWEDYLRQAKMTEALQEFHFGPNGQVEEGLRAPEPNAQGPRFGPIRQGTNQTSPRALGPC